MHGEGALEGKTFPLGLFHHKKGCYKFVCFITSTEAQMYIYKPLTRFTGEILPHIPICTIFIDKKLANRIFNSEGKLLKKTSQASKLETEMSFFPQFHSENV